MDRQTPSPGQSVTRLLTRIRAGERAAAHELLPLVYAELRRLAQGVFSDQGAGQTLQPTALVNEAWLKLAAHLAPIEDRRHFLVVAGKAMRQVITDHARGRNARKRGGDLRRVTLDEAMALEAEGDVDLVELDDSLRQLAERSERHAEIAELRIFSGLTIDETAESLGVSPRTVDADWALAKAWLRRDLARGA